jgi:O-antigen/teichoic acid export membrane protein
VRRLLPLLRTRAAPVAAARIVSAGLAALIVFVTSAVLTTSTRGEFAALQTAAVLLATLGGLSLALGVSIVVGERAEAARPAALLSLLGALALGVVLVRVGLLAAGPLGVSRATATAVALTAATISAYGGLQGIAVGLGRMRYYGGADVARALAAVIAVIAALAAGVRAPGALVAVWAAGTAVGVVALLRLAPRGSAPSLREVARVAVRRSLRAHPATLAGLAVARLDIVVLAAVSSHPQVAYYSLAVVIAEAAWLMPSALAVTSLSDFVRLTPADAWQAARRALRRTLGIAAVSAVLAAAGGVVAILLFLPGAYHASLAPLGIALVGAVPYSVGHVVSPYLVTTVDRPGLVTLIAAITLAVDVALVLVLGGPLGAIGAAIASTASYAVHAALNAGALRRAQPA